MLDDEGGIGLNVVFQGLVPPRLDSLGGVVEPAALNNGEDEDGDHPVEAAVEPGQVFSDGSLNDGGTVVLQFQPGAILASSHDGLGADDEILYNHASREVAESSPIPLDDGCRVILVAHDEVPHVRSKSSPGFLEDDGSSNLAASNHVEEAAE